MDGVHRPVGVPGLAPSAAAQGGSVSFFLFIVYLSFSFLRPFELYLPWLEDARPMLVLWVIAAVAGLSRALSTQLTGGRALHFWLVLTFTVCTTFGHLWQGYVGGATGALSTFSTSSMLYVLVLLNVTDIERLRTSCRALLACMVALSLLTILGYHTGYKSDLLVLWQSTGIDDPDIASQDPTNAPANITTPAYMARMHATGFLSDPNDFAQAIVLVMPLLGLLFVRGRHLHNLLWVISPAAVMLYAIFLTHSRGAILGLAALLFFGIRQRLGNLRTAILVGLVVLAPMLTQFGGGRAMSTKEESAAQRIDAWYEGFQMLRSNPVFGVGFDNFQEHHYLTAHNSFVLCFAELGLLGYFLWIALLVVSYLGMNRVIRFVPTGSREHQTASLLRAAMLGYMTCAWFLSRTYQPGMYVMLALSAATWHCSRAAVSADQRTAYDAPLPWKYRTLQTAIVTMAAVYGFILIDRYTSG